MKRESLNTPTQALHFQSRSGMLSHTAGTCFDPRISIAEWNLENFLAQWNFKAGKSTSELRFVYGQEIFRSLCSGSKELRLLNQMI